MKRFLKILEGLVPALAVIGIQLVWSFIFSFLFMIGLIVNTVIASGGEVDIRAITSYLTLEIMISADFMYLASATAILASGVVFAFWYKRMIRFERKIEYKKALSVRNIMLIILLGIASQFTVSGGMSLLQPYLVDLFDDYAKVLETIVGANPIIVILLTVIIAPVTEELIFRAVILKKLNNALPFLWANLIQAAIFGIYHMNIIQGVYAFGLGIMMGYVTRRCKTILASILLHMAVNGSSYLLYLFPDHRITYLLLMLVGGAIIIVTFINIKSYEDKIPQSEPTYTHW